MTVYGHAQTEDNSKERSKVKSTGLAQFMANMTEGEYKRQVKAGLRLILDRRGECFQTSETHRSKGSNPFVSRCFRPLV